MQEQFQQLARQKQGDHQHPGRTGTGKGKLVVIGQDCVEALQALRNAGEEVRNLESSTTCFFFLEICVVWFDVR